MSEPYRIAYWQTELSADGPGILLRDIRRDTAPTHAAMDIMAGLGADILVLGGVDYDHGTATLRALRDGIAARDGREFPHLFAARPNSGLPTGLDLDGDGRLNGARDAQGYGRFSGQGGMAVLSRWPITLIADHSDRLWRDMPDSLMIDATGRTGAEATGAESQRLASTVLWELATGPPDAPITLMILHATPPVFDGPEDRNGRRNADEIRFWQHRLSGDIGSPLQPPFAIIGTLNLDPDRGQGRREVIRDLLSDPRLTDPQGLRGTATVNWPAPGPGEMRVDYILPSSDLRILGAKVMATNPEVSRHNPIWIDLQAAE